ncbi:MAG: hypothetical protein ACLRIS_09705 [Flavonifractor plautii]
MLTCEQALELISAQLDGALTAGGRGAGRAPGPVPGVPGASGRSSTLHQLLPTLAEEPPPG